MRYSILLGLLLPASALAYPANPDPALAAPISEPDPLRSPGFVTLDRFDASSRAGGEMSYVLVDGDDVQALRFDLHGHYVDARSGFGGYANVPFTFLASDNDSNGALGGLELGGLYAKRLSPEIGIVARIGVALPTANEEDALQNVILAYSRVTDVVTAFPGTSLRVSVSPMFRSGQMFARLDVGFDAIVDSEASDDTTTLLRLSPGIGFDGGTFAVMGELTALRSTEDESEEFVTCGALSARFAAGAVSPYAALVIPFDEDLREFINASITIGIDAAL